MEILSILLQNGRIDALTFAVIFGQCSDQSATVRAKALSILADCIESNDRSVVELFDIIFTEDVERQVPSAEEEEETDIVELLQGEGPINRYQRVCCTFAQSIRYYESSQRTCRR